jgi:hypothetical protein
VLFLGGVTAAGWVNWIRIYGMEPIKTMAEVLAILIVPRVIVGAVAGCVLYVSSGS